MDAERIIAGLGTRNDHVAVSPRFEPKGAKLSPDEVAVLSAVGKVRQIGELILGLELDENRAIAALLALRAKGVLVKARVQARPRRPAVSAAMQEEVALTEALKVQILELEDKLETADHFALLGVPAGADAATAKTAFYQLSRVLHPDRYFRRNLGSFRSRLEKVFKALSTAHKDLTDPVKREKYLTANPGLRPVEPAPVVPAPKRAPMKRLSWKRQDLPDLAGAPAPKPRK